MSLQWKEVERERLVFQIWLSLEYEAVTKAFDSNCTGETIRHTENMPRDVNMSFQVL
jgi:hypothetical protein